MFEIFSHLLPSLTPATLLLLLMLILTSIWLLISSYSYFNLWQSQGIPTVSWVLWEYCTKPLHEAFGSKSKKYGKLYGLYLLTTRVLVVGDAKLANDFPKKELSLKYPKAWPGYLGETNAKHSQVLIEADDKWKRIRTISMSIFTSAKLKCMLISIESIAKIFVDHLEKFAINGEEFDFKLYLNAFQIDVIAAAAFNIQTNSLDKPNGLFQRNLTKIIKPDIPFQRILCMWFPKLAKLLKLNPFDKEAVLYVDNITFKIIDERLKKISSQDNSDRQKNGNNRIIKRDLINLLLDEVNKINSSNDSSTGKKLIGLSKEEIAGQALTFFVAGSDTATIAISHMVYLLIKYPEWQEKLFDEIKNNIKTTETKEQTGLSSIMLDYDLLSKLPLLNAFINETLRLYPPLPFVLSVCKDDTTLLDTGIRIPSGTVIVTSVISIHRDPDYFPEPYKFKPERFLPVDGENSSSASNVEKSIAYMPFGVGPRDCIGKRFALMSIRFTMTYLIYNFEFTPNPNLKIAYSKGHFLMLPKKLPIRIKKRQHLE